MGLDTERGDASLKMNICMGCMRDKGSEEPVCPFCGYEEGSPRFADYLAPRTILDKRYLVGKVLSYNGEGVLYIGYDTMNSRRVDIREYFPDTLASRDKDGQAVCVAEGRQIPFKAYLSDYVDILHKLTRMRTLSCVVQVLGYVEANNTIYGVLEHVEGTPIREYLLKRESMLSWQEASDLMLPVIRTLGLLHQDGILHRGISADTIFVTPYNTVKIDGFAISAVRAARTEIAAELFPGYSAPEQYSAVSLHGCWTDVYAVCALLYTMLTGQRPPEALIRSADKKLLPPRSKNETVPAYVSEAILNGLELDTRRRIQNMDALLGALTGIPVVEEAPESQEGVKIAAKPSPRIPYNRAKENPTIDMEAVKSGKAAKKPDGHTIHYDPTEVRKQAEAEGAEAERRRTRKLVLNSMLIALPILLLALLLTFWLLFGGNRSHTGRLEESSRDPVSDEWLVSSYPESSEGSVSQGGSFQAPESSEEAPEESSEESLEESSEETLQMENFVGKKYADVIADAQYKEIYLFKEALYDYSDTVAEGYIMGQDVTEGLEIAKGTQVQLTVSRGSRYIRLPDYEKKKEEDYLARLDALNVPYIVSYRTNSGYPAGYVVGTSLGSSMKYDIVQGDTIEVYVSKD